MSEFESEMQELDYGKMKSRKVVTDFDREVAFTNKHLECKNLHPYLREAECLRTQSRLIMTSLKSSDHFAGTLDRMFVGIDPERGDLVEAAFFYQREPLEEQLKSSGLSTSSREDVAYLLEYWKVNASYHRIRKSFPKHIQNGMPGDDYYNGLQISFPMYGMGGPCLDYEKLVKLGIPGLRNLVMKEMQAAVVRGDVETEFFMSMLTALDIFIETANRYAEKANLLAQKEDDGMIRSRLNKIESSLLHLTSHKPETLHQGIQLVWLYNLLSLAKNYGRMDIYLGDLLVDDLEEGRLTEQEALDMLVGLWGKIVERGDYFNNRILIGGKGRENEKNADKFAMLALEAQKIVNHAIPQLSLRWHEGMDQQLWDKSFEVLALGSTMPIIYNDDANIPAMKLNMEISQAEAEDYAFYGCGEFLIDHKAVASPDAAINILKVLDVTLRNGKDSFTGEYQGLKLGGLESFKTFEDLQVAFAMQVEYQMKMLAEAQDIIYQMTGEEASFPFLSLLYDDCIERGKPLLAGGVRYRCGTVEAFGNNSVGDALYAIKVLVYDEKIISPEKMVQVLDSNFAGYEAEHNLMLKLAKFGNDLSEVDKMVMWVNEVVCKSSALQKDNTDLHSFLTVLINNGDSVLHGKTTGASADGRKNGEPVSNGNQPTAGMDSNGPTALLNSMSKLKAEWHAGATQNIKVSRTTMNQNTASVKSLIKAYFVSGGTQIMFTVTDRKELEKALKEPKKYRHVFVRVGGYSERFVNLPQEIQQELIKRTLY
jgi:pyruvate-formate lyase